jgi:hypothetical protein
MATAIHVNGPAVLYTGQPLATSSTIYGGGSLDSPGQLGISEDGVDISLQPYDEPVIADTGGPHCPVDLQDLGMTALIRARLVIYDKSLLQALRKRSGQAEGQLSAIGSLVASNGNDARLIVTSADEVFRFWHTYLRSAQETKVGAKRTIWTTTWFAWAFIGTATTAAGATLYDHTNA